MICKLCGGSNDVTKPTNHCVDCRWGIHYIHVLSESRGVKSVEMMRRILELKRFMTARTGEKIGTRSAVLIFAAGLRSGLGLHK